MFYKLNLYIIMLSPFFIVIVTYIFFFFFEFDKYVSFIIFIALIKDLKWRFAFLAEEKTNSDAI